MPDFLVGLDLGQAADPTALVVLKRSLYLKDDGLPVRRKGGVLLYSFSCVHAARVPLLTPYPAIVAQVKGLVDRPELGGNVHLVVDATGVGRAVMDLFLDAALPCRLWPITITGGTEWSAHAYRQGCQGFHVPKLELASSVQGALASRRLTFAALKDAVLLDTIKRELLAFQVKTTTKGNDTFAARQGAHDDLVLALATALWLGERPRIGHPAVAEAGHVVRLPEDQRDRFGAPKHPETAALVAETLAERAALAAAKAKDDAERAERWHDPMNDAFFRRW